MTINLVPARDRAVSVAEVDWPLTPAALRAHFLDREAYRRTRYIIARAQDRLALIEVGRRDPDALFAPISTVKVLAGPDDCAWVDAPSADTSVPTQMAAAAREHAPEARCAVVQGRYAHVSFILDPRPIQIRVVDVVPPEPPKLIDQVRRVLDVAEDLPPVELVPDVIDLRSLASTRPSAHYLFPCRGSGTTAGEAEVSYLDQRPARHDWVLVGCARSRELHRWFYGNLPDVVETCPRELRSARTEAALLKCCLIEEHVEQDGTAVVVPWGATLDEVREGLEWLVRSREPTWAPA